MRNNTTDVLLVLVIGVCAVAGLLGLVALSGQIAHQGNVDKQELVRTCADAGGSWVIDGEQGECVIDGD